MTKKELGWGMNVFLAVAGFLKKIPFEKVSISVPHEKDIQEGEDLRRFRIEQLKDNLTGIQEASAVLEAEQ